jgi:NDP-sugar pyrophosphorylase family protein/aminoglycoside/choline kinase family phosphotransferase
MSNLNTCFILAAGLGERMRPMTNHIPKPLLPIAGKPLLESIIEKVISSGFSRIGVNSHHLSGLIEAWIANSVFREKIRLFHEPVILNTGGALKNAGSFLEYGNFLVHNGDIISDINLAALFERHRHSGNIATLATFDCPAINNVLVTGSGLFMDAGRGLQPSGDERLVAFSGIAVYSPAFLKFLPEGASSVLVAWTEAVRAGYRIGTFDTSGHGWSDIGSPSAYASAVVKKLRDEGETVYAAPAAEVGRDVAIDGSIIIEKTAVVGNSAKLRNCIILPGGIVAAEAQHENSIIGTDYAIAAGDTAFGIHIEGKGLLIGSGGSDRKYYRRRDTEQSIVVMECGPDDPDFDRHIEYTNFFGKYGIPVARILSSDRKTKTALIEDLGDMSLYSWRKCPRSPGETEQLYRRVMEIIARLHGTVSDHVSECPTLAARIFDYDYLRWETSYFLEKFIMGVCGRNIENTSALNDEFHSLALKTDSFTKRIIHRDFQSQNIMITKVCIPRIIDYQGARMAPPAYDIASILWDPYAPLTDDMRTRLLNFYQSLLEKTADSWFSSAEFNESLIYCRLQRHMQALGAYGYLSRTKNKTYFLKHVPEAVRLLKEEALLVHKEFPFIAGLVGSL